MRFDYVLVGGGLQNGLIALSLLHRRPEVRLALVERGRQVGGNHIWCFHADDVPDEAAEVIAPLVAHRWPGHTVRFPAHTRELAAPYGAITSARFAQVVSETIAAAPNAVLLTGAAATEVSAHEVHLADGQVLAAQVVIDARGPDRLVDDGPRGYQKFLGLELALSVPHELTQPVLMDALVPQTDGFRFFYTLPLAPDRVLVEDTYFSDTPDLDPEGLARGILAYAEAQGFRVDREVRRESGVLALPLDGHPMTTASGPLVAGYAGGWFHPVTGYSLPVALRLATLVARLPASQLFGEALDRLAASQRRQLRFCYRLNKMLFRWFLPEHRFHVLERFYRLPEPTIRRFYAMTLGAADRARILFGRPPRGMSIRAALSARSTP